MAEGRSVAQRLYLSVYNWVSFFGWSVACSSACSSSFFFGFLHFDWWEVCWIGHGHLVGSFEFYRAQVLYYATLALLGGGHETVYAAVKLPLLFSQTAMLTEVKHSVAL
jgi:hypothetical protein